MTRDEWRDIVATMSPKQREAMAYFAEACTDMHAGDCPWPDSVGQALDFSLGCDVTAAGQYLEGLMR